MASVLPPTVACTVRTVAAACWLLLGCEVVAAAAVIPPPRAAAAARLMLAMMILGCRMVSSFGINGALSTNTDSRNVGFTRPAGYSSGEAAGGGERGGCGRDLRWGSRRLGRAGAGGCGALR